MEGKKTRNRSVLQIGRKNALHQIRQNLGPYDFNVWYNFFRRTKNLEKACELWSLFRQASGSSKNVGREKRTKHSYKKNHHRRKFSERQANLHQFISDKQKDSSYFHRANYTHSLSMMLPQNRTNVEADSRAVLLV